MWSDEDGDLTIWGYACDTFDGASSTIYFQFIILNDIV